MSSRMPARHKGQASHDTSHALFTSAFPFKAQAGTRSLRQGIEGRLSPCLEAVKYFEGESTQGLDRSCNYFLRSFPPRSS